MKTINGFNKVLFLLAVSTLFFMGTNNAISQEKKKLIRVIEIDDKGEYVVKEIAVPTDKHYKILTDESYKLDSITRDAKEKIKIEEQKIDSIRMIIHKNNPNHLEVLAIPQIPPMPDFDFDFDIPEPIGTEADFNFFIPDSINNHFKMYYNESGFDKNADLSKMLEEVENGTFDPSKWNMKEVEKDNLKEFKTNGKGDVLIFGDNRSKRNHFYGFSRIPDKFKKEFEKQKKALQMSYFISDSLDNDEIKEYTIQSTLNSDGDDNNNVLIVSPSNKKVKKVFINKDGDNEKTVKVFVTVNDNGKTKIELTNPSNDDYKILQQAGLAKEDKTKLFSPESLTFISGKDKDKYTIGFNGDEKGKVKITIIDKEGNTVFSDELNNSKGSVEKEVEIKNLKTGDYFIQAQQNGKSITLKMEIEIEK